MRKVETYIEKDNRIHKGDQLSVSTLELVRAIELRRAPLSSESIVQLAIYNLRQNTQPL